MINSSPTILIPNVTSNANLGDAAMLEVLVKMVGTLFPKAKIVIHASQPETHNATDNISVRPTMYHWAVFDTPTLWVRVWRMLAVVVLLIAMRWRWKLLERFIRSRVVVLDQIAADFEKAQLVVMVGGGYLHTKPGISQSLNLMMQLVPMLVGRWVSGRVITAPIGFGPFAYHWQARMTAWVLNQLDLVAIREKYSWKAISSWRGSRMVRSCDHALLLSQDQSVASEHRPPVVGFTIREWLTGEKQMGLEKAFVEGLAKLASNNQVEIQPIIQVDAPQYGEGDVSVTERVIEGLTARGCVTLPMVKIKNVAHAKEVYGGLTLLVGMRMHSNIIAATQAVPFVAVAYEYKTQGIASDLGLEDYSIVCERVTGDTLYAQVHLMLERIDEVKKLMLNHLAKIQEKEFSLWMERLEI